MNRFKFIYWLNRYLKGETPFEQFIFLAGKAGVKVISTDGEVVFDLGRTEDGMDVVVCLRPTQSETSS